MGSKATSPTTQSTQQIDDRIAAQDEAIVIRLDNGSVIDIEQLSDEVVFEVLGFANEINETAASVAIAGIEAGDKANRDALDLVDEINETAAGVATAGIDSAERANLAALTTTERIADEAFGFGTGVTEDAFAFGTDVLGDALELVKESQTSARAVQEAAGMQLTDVLAAQRTEAAQGLGELLNVVKVLGIAGAAAVAIRAFKK